MRVKVKKLIEKHIKLIENENFYQLFINANYMHFNNDDMDELIDILENYLGMETLQSRIELFIELFNESITPFITGRVSLENHIEYCFDNDLQLSYEQMSDIINKNSNKAKVDKNFMMEIL